MPRGRADLAVTPAGRAAAPLTTQQGLSRAALSVPCGLVFGCPNWGCSQRQGVAKDAAQQPTMPREAPERGVSVPERQSAAAEQPREGPSHPL